MKKLFFLLSLLIPSMALAELPLEKAVNELEAKSTSLTIDVNSYRNTLLEKFRSLQVKKNGLNDFNGVFKMREVLLDDAYRLIANGEELSKNVRQIMQAGRSDLMFLSYAPGEPSLADRVFVISREIDCSVFSLKLINSAQSTLDESLVLANDVAKACKSINNKELAKNQVAAPVKNGSAR
jgi:hypothetical protein